MESQEKLPPKKHPEMRQLAKALLRDVKSPQKPAEILKEVLEENAPKKAA